MGIYKAIWTIIALVAIDLSVNVLTRYPDTDPAVAEINSVQRYFNYGRSIESKVRWMVGQHEDVAAPLARAGWLQSQDLGDNEAGRVDIAIYGMSFSARVGEALERVGGVNVRARGGPAAPLNRTYAHYLLDKKRHDASIVVLGILASSFPYTATVTHMTWNFEAPSAHFYPRFQVDSNGRLSRIEPPVKSLNEFRGILSHREDWADVVEFIEAHDAFFDRWSFRADPLDHTVIGRMLRRAWAQYAHRQSIARFHNASGFTNHENNVAVARKIIEEFAADVRRDGRVPAVVLFNDQGYSNHLYLALHGLLDDNQIAYVSSHEIAQADEFNKFQPDGHFRPDVDDQIAMRLLEQLEGNLPRPGSARE